MGARTGGAQDWGETEAAGNGDPEWSEVRSRRSEGVRERGISEQHPETRVPGLRLMHLFNNIYSVFHKT